MTNSFAGGMTVSPSYNEATGEVSYDDAEVYDHSGRQHVIEQHQREQLNHFETTDGGPPRHTWADLPAEGVQRIMEDDYVVNEDELDYIIIEDEEDDMSVDYREIVTGAYEITDGPENYQTLLHWANDNLEPAWINQFDQVMDSGNPELIYGAVNQLKSMFLNR